MFIIVRVGYNILCLEDHNQYTSGVKILEREDGLGITDDDLTPGNRLIWSTI